MILHLVSRKEWEAASKPSALAASEQVRQSGQSAYDRNKWFLPAAYAKDGFVHATKGDALLLKVANAFYKNIPGEFVALEIDESKLKSELKWEDPAPPKPAPVEAAPPGAASPIPQPTLPPEVAAEIGALPVAMEPAPAAKAIPKKAEDAPKPAEPPVLFPHIYGPINRDAITGIRIVLRDKDGAFTGFTPAFKPDTRTATQRAADDLLNATDDFSEALKNYKDRVKSQMDEWDADFKKNM